MLCFFVPHIPLGRAAAASASHLYMASIIGLKLAVDPGTGQLSQR